MLLFSNVCYYSVTLSDQMCIRFALPLAVVDWQRKAWC